MKVLVTGAGGFVGKRLVHRLAEGGHHVLAMLHRPLSDADAAFFSPAANISSFVADLESFGPAVLESGIDAMVLLAQSAHFREFPDRAQQVFRVNVDANLRLLDWAVRAGVRRVVVASSGGIYGGRPGVSFHESDTLAVDSPVGFYLGSKLCLEIVTQNYLQHFESVVTIRPFFIYGAGQRGDMFVTRIINSVRDGKPIFLQGNDGLRINPIHVDDAATAFDRALGLAGNRIINIAGPDVISLRALAAICAKHIGVAPVFESVAGDPVDYMADITVAREALRLEPRSIEQGIAETIAAS